MKRQQQNEVALSNAENDTKTKGTPLKSKSNDRLASIKMQSVSTPMNMASPAETRPSGSAKSVERSQQGKVGDGPDAPRGVGGGYADMRETPRLTTGGLAKIATRCNQVEWRSLKINADSFLAGLPSSYSARSSCWPGL